MDSTLPAVAYEQALSLSLQYSTVDPEESLLPVYCGRRWFFYHVWMFNALMQSFDQFFLTHDDICFLLQNGIWHFNCKPEHS